jgi:predicted acetyltransferase
VTCYLLLVTYAARCCSLDPPPGLEAFLREVGNGESGFGGTEYASGAMSLHDYLHLLVDYAAGRNMADGHVQATTFWAIDGGVEVVGMLRLRHRLNDALLNSGGHIGYYVRPAARGNGYATEMLRLALDEARALGIERVLLTAYTTNHASVRVIEKNGGVLENVVPHPETGEPHGRFWIDLSG